MPTIAANGIEVSFEERGAGPPLLLLHGATSLGREDFAAQIPLFSKAFRCILPDARGHGFTRWDAAEGFRYDWLVDDVLAFVDALGLETFHVVGFSMGAMTALMLASRHPSRLRTLTVVGITTQREPRASVGRRLMHPERVDREDPEWAALLGRRHDAGQGTDAWRRLLPAIAADIAAQPLLTPRDLREIDCPSLVVCGDRDPFVPVEHAAGLRRQLPDGRLFVAPECGHEVMSRKPALFNEAVAGFFRATETTARERSVRRAELAPSAGGPPVAAPTPRVAAGSTGSGSAVVGNPLAGGPPDDQGADRDWLASPRVDQQTTDDGTPEAHR